MANFALSYHPVPTTHATRRAGPGIAPPLQRRGTQPVPLRNKVPHLAEGCRRSRRGGLSPEALAKGGLMQQPKSGKNQIIRRIGRMNAHRTLWGRGVSHIVRRGVGLIRAPLSLRRSTNNVENVGVRLRQSSLNMSAGIRPQCFFIYWIATLRSR